MPEDKFCIPCDGIMFSVLVSTSLGSNYLVTEQRYFSNGGLDGTNTARTLHISLGEDSEENSGRERQGNGDAEGPATGEPPPRPTGTWVQAKGGKGGSAPARERRQTQTRGAGCRDEQRRLQSCGYG